MAERPVEELTLREMFTNAEGVVRDVTEHLRQNFHPKARDIEEVVRSYKDANERDAITDSAVRTCAAALLASDDYSQALFQKLDRYLIAIEERAQTAVNCK